MTNFSMVDLGIYYVKKANVHAADIDDRQR